MKTWLVLLFVLFSTVGYAIPERMTPLYPSNDPEFSDYIEDFILRSKDLISHRDFEHINISFKPQEYSSDAKGKDTVVIGMCFWNWGILGAKNRIEIDPAYWKQAGPFEKWNLIFHEMGHCVCNRVHPDLKEDAGWFVRWLSGVGVQTVHSQDHYLHDGCPATIMHPYNISNECVHDHQRYYVEELFAECHPTPLSRIYK